MKPAVFAPADRKHSCWLGGAILSQMAKFEMMWITKKEYDEVGKSIVHMKCFSIINYFVAHPAFQFKFHIHN